MNFRSLLRNCICVFLTMMLSISSVDASSHSPKSIAPDKLELEVLHGELNVLVYLNKERDELDNYALSVLYNLGQVHDFYIDTTSIPHVISEHISQNELIVFLNRNGDDLGIEEKNDIEEFVRAGKGFVGIYTAGLATSNWPWYDSLYQSYMSDLIPVQNGEIIVSDRVHPSTKSISVRFNIETRFANLDSDIRGKAHVLASVNTQTIDNSSMGYDHPVSWCHDYSGGKVWITTLGGETTDYESTDFLEHLAGGIEWAGGVQEGDGGATIDDLFEIKILDEDNVDPMALDVAPDGRVFFVEKNGSIKVWKPDLEQTLSAGVIPVFPGGEGGLTGIALDPEFDENNYIYLHYAFQDGNWDNTGQTEQRVSRFILSGDEVDFSTEEILLKYYIDREPGIHSAGSLGFDSFGNLYISSGDNTQYGNGPTPNQYAPIDDRPGQMFSDAQRSSANTNNLRGKILRIKPSETIGGGYSIPDGNLFQQTDSTLAEIYVMGLRNPFKITLNQKNNWLIWGDVGPDAVLEDPDRGPIGRDEINLAKASGNYGWPYFVGDNQAYNEYDFDSEVSGPKFNPDLPINHSANNTGKTILPPATPSFLWALKVHETPEFPEFGTGNPTMITGPVYHFNPSSQNQFQLPAYYDNTLFIMDWSRLWIKEVKLDEEGGVIKINDFLSSRDWKRPLDFKVGPDGCLYLLEWGLGWGGPGNTDSRLSRICYNPGNQSPVAIAISDKDAGQLPLEVNFYGSTSYSPSGASLSYTWDFKDGSPIDTFANPSHLFTVEGEYLVELSVRSEDGLSGTTSLRIVAGNTRPDVQILTPLNGSFFNWGDSIDFKVEVEDFEEGSTPVNGIECENLENLTYLGHNDHAHPYEIINKCNGNFVTSASGHSTLEDNIFMLFEGKYTDRGINGNARLTGSIIHVLNPTLKQAEHFTNSRGVSVSETMDELSLYDISHVDSGDYISFDPMNLFNVDSVFFRLSSMIDGGYIEIHNGMPDENSTKVGEVNIPNTLSEGEYITVGIPIEDPGGTYEYFFSFHHPNRISNICRLNWIHFNLSQTPTPVNKPNSDPFAVIVYPNPATNTLFIKMEDVKGKGSIQLYDLNGRLWSSVVQEIPQMKSLTRSLDIRTLKEGTYLLKIHIGEKWLVKKVVKSKK